MKSLLSFKLFESLSLNDVINNINDILLPIKDLGYIIKIRHKHVRKDKIKIYILPGELQWVLNVDIVDALHHLISYARSEGFRCDDNTEDIKIKLYNIDIPLVYRLSDLDGLESGDIHSIEIHFER